MSQVPLYSNLFLISTGSIWIVLEPAYSFVLYWNCLNGISSAVYDYVLRRNKQIDINARSS